MEKLNEVFKMSSPENHGKKELKDIINNEDKNLYARTNLFLVANGIFFTAVGVSQVVNFKFIVGIVGLIVSVLWLVCACQSCRVVKALHIKFSEKYPCSNGDEYYWYIDDKLPKCEWFRPAELLGIILPLVFILAWIFVIFFV